MANRSDITPELCRQLLRYEPETGKLFWRKRGMEWFSDRRSYSTWNAKYAGREAFLVRTEDGYLKGLLLRSSFRASRVVWAIVHGVWPKGEIDHINGVKDDNRVANLRDVPRSVNARNRGMRRNNRSGITGVKLDLNSLRWHATIRGNGKNLFLGSFENRVDAIAARKAAEVEFGYSEGHGLQR
ncbi:conserved hypothetical protein [Sphingobium sp. SYK-6]|uniref:HNH endonuclease n=1 Tax=Sphingobium sp. (strain NBRC 103272 / SYK-6) TaxID=627192 RepID=UPI000227712B|nr:HNH endonuclease [Sphingobium sp. SYK-6]BAK66879.1 conserved hypothetical protein [Sphingobium sp. SYK-6]